MFESEIAEALHRAATSARAESAAVAAKLAAVALVARLRREADGRDQVPVSRQAEFVAAEVATALSVSTLAAHGLIDLGETLATRLPETRRALERGDLDLARVRVIVDRTAAILDLGVLAEVERRVLEVVLVPGRCVTRGQVARVTDRVIAAVDPGLVIAQRKRAEADRDVVVRPDADGMCSLWGALPGVGGVALEDRLRTLALGPCGEDPRTVGQRRADALVALAHGDAYLACECGSPVCPTSATETDHQRCRPVIQVVVPIETLLGVADLPGVLARYGIVDADLVRTLAADARWQQLLSLDGAPIALGRSTKTTPTSTSTTGTGTAVDVDPAALSYTPSASLARLVRTRDGHCRFPGCTTPAPSCDLDHAVPFDHHDPAAGGLTVASNLACLCRWHHRLKTQGHWTVRMDPDATQHWTGPDGRTATSTPAGMPETGPGRSPGAGSDQPVRTREVAPVVPVMWHDPGALSALTAAQLGCHPDHDLPPDDHPPNRWTTDGRWADDTWTDHDLDTALDSLVREVNRDARARHAVARAAHTSSRPVPAQPGDDRDEQPPF